MKSRTVLVAMGLCCSTSLFANDAKVDITSFRSAGLRTDAAELCGKVTGSTAPGYTVAHVTVDEKSGKPGHYYTLVGKDGLFCVAVVTYKGTAIANAEVLGQQLQSEPAFLSK